MRRTVGALLLLAVVGCKAHYRNVDALICEQAEQPVDVLPTPAATVPTSPVPPILQTAADDGHRHAPLV